MDIQFEPAQQPDTSIAILQHLNNQVYLIDKILEWEERFPEAYQIRQITRQATKTAFAQIAHIQTLITTITEFEASEEPETIDDSGVDSPTGPTGGQTETD